MEYDYCIYICLFVHHMGGFIHAFYLNFYLIFGKSGKLTVCQWWQIRDARKEKKKKKKKKYPTSNGNVFNHSFEDL